MLRSAAYAGMSLCVLLMAAILLITQTPLLSGTIVPRLREALNLDVDVDAVYVGWDGRLVLRNAKFRLPDVDGPSSEFLTVSRVRMGINWLRSMSAEPEIRGILLIEPTLRVSLSPDDMSVNIGSLQLPAYGEAQPGAAPLPTITATDARLILAEVIDQEFHPLKTITINGRLAPDPNADADTGGYIFELQETRPGSAEAAGARVKGTYVGGEIRLTIEDFSFEPLPMERLRGGRPSLLRNLNLKGTFPRASLIYTQEQGLEAELALRGVAMNLPVEPQDAHAEGSAATPEGEPQFLRLYDTEGTIRFMRDSVKADVRGFLEDMPYHVEWDHHGLHPSAAFTCRFTSDNFRVERNPALLPYTPPMVVDHLREFSSPMATVSTTMTILRDRPNGDRPGPISVDGHMSIRDGVAAFEGFPYEFESIHGTFEFSDTRIQFDDITGQSASGARMRARGLITPLDDDAEVDITVEVRGAPIDNAMAEAFGEGHDHVIPALFSRERYEALVSAGLVRTRSEAEADARELAAVQAAMQGSADEEPDRQHLAARAAALEQRKQIPIFEFGGTCNAKVVIRRPPGPAMPWSTTIDLHIPDAGIVPEVFPIPIRARDLTAQIHNNEGRLTGGTFRTATGAAAEVTASFTVPIVGDDLPRPDIAIRATELPLDALLIHALPGADDARHKDLLRRLGVSGIGAGEVRIANRNIGTEEEDLGFETDFRFENVAMRPVAARPEQSLAITQAVVRVRADEERLTLDFEGVPEAPEYIGSAGGPVTGSIRAEFLAWGDDGSATYTADLQWPVLPVQLPVETIVRALSPQTAAKIEESRREYHPEGIVTIQALIDSGGDGESVRVRFSEARDLVLDLYGERLTFQQSAGSIMISSEPDSPVVFETVETEVAIADRPGGIVALNGSWPLNGHIEGAQLRAHVRNAVLDSPLVHRLLADYAPSSVMRFIEEHDVRGTADVRTMLISEPEGASWQVLRVEPRSLALTLNGERIAFDEMAGTVELHPDGSGLARSLSGRAAEWNVLADAAWGTRPDHAVRLRINALTLAGTQLAPDLRAVLPTDLRSMVDDLSLDITGPFEIVSDDLIEVTFDPDGSMRAIDVPMTARFRGLALSAGLRLTDITGTAVGRFARNSARAAPEFTVAIRADSLTAEGIAMNDGAAIVESGNNPGEIIVRDVSADVHEGRLTGSARIAPAALHDALASGEQPSPRTFDASVQLAGIRFSPLLDDLLDEDVQSSIDPEASLDGVGAGAGDTPEIGDRSRGMLDATIALAGTIGDPQSRRGRGSIWIAHGRVLTLPVVLGLIEVSNLQLPVNAPLDYAHADFYIDGGTIHFREIAVTSRSIEIFGRGTMTWPDQYLDLRFDTRSSRPIPILSHLIRGIRDELITTTVRGRLGEHEIRLRQPQGSGRPTVRNRPAPEAPTEAPPAKRGPGGGDFGPGIAPRTSSAEPPS